MKLLQSLKVLNPFATLDDDIYDFPSAVHHSDIHEILKGQDTLVSSLRRTDTMSWESLWLRTAVCSMVLFCRCSLFCDFVVEELGRCESINAGTVTNILGRWQLRNQKKGFLPARTMRNLEKSKQNTDACSYNLDDVGGALLALVFCYHEPDGNGLVTEPVLVQWMRCTGFSRGWRLMEPHLRASLKELGLWQDGPSSSSSSAPAKKRGTRTSLALRWLFKGWTERQVCEAISSELATLPGGVRMSDDEIIISFCKLCKSLQNLASTKCLNNWRGLTKPILREEFRMLAEEPFKEASSRSKRKASAMKSSSSGAKRKSSSSGVKRSRPSS